MPKTGRRGHFCPGQTALLMAYARNARGRFTRVVDGLPFQVMAVRRDARGRFAPLTLAR
jgi:hypothetical protein